MANEPVVKRGRIPRGYSLVLKGNVYVTGNCRKQSQAADETVYLVVDTKETQIGIAVPTGIYEGVKQKEVETRLSRAANVDRRDKAIKKEFEQVVLNEFPRLPLGELSKILEKALEKRKGKVGRTGQLSDHRKAQLAVRAHIRHCHTPYDKMLRASGKKGLKTKHLARQTVQKQVDDLAAAWEHDRAGQPPRLRASGAHAPASSSASPPPARSTEIAKTKSISTRAKPARMRQSATTLTAAPANDPPTWPEAAPLNPRRPLEIRQHVRREIIDLTMDDDDPPPPKVPSRSRTTQRMRRNS